MMSQKVQSMKWFLLLALVLVLITGISCNFAVGIVESTQTPNTDSEVRVHEDAAVEINDTQNQGDVHPKSPNTEIDCQKSLHAGLIYGEGNQNGESLWQIGPCGGRIKLGNHANVEISPGGDQALFIKDDDIWTVNLIDGRLRNLTNTPDRIEIHPQWWSGRSNIVIFGSWEKTDDLGPTTGFLSLITTDGSNYRVLADRSSNAQPAPEPNGSRIAYDLGGTAWLYDLERDGNESFDVSLYGLNILKGMKIGSPAWSPDGKRLAWWVGGVFSPSIEGSVALAVFDLDVKMVQLLHPYNPIGTGGWLPAPIWSPDGNWLAVMTLSEAHKTDLWVIRSDGGEEHNLGYAGNPVWHPDGESLVYTSISEGLLKFEEVGVWGSQAIDLPPGIVPRNWITPTLQISTEQTPSFTGDVYFASSPEMSQSQFVFPFGTPQIFAIWSYRDMRDGLTIRREWYLDGGLWLVREEPWDFTKYGEHGVVRDISIYDFDNGLKPGIYQLRLYIDDQEQSLGNTEAFSAASFVVSEPGITSPIISPDWSMAAVVKPPGTLSIQSVADEQDKRTILTVDEISSLAWYPDGTHIIFSIRDRSSQNPRNSQGGFADELWIVNLATGQSYPLADPSGQSSGMGLHTPYISPDGRFIAAIEGDGWADACYVAKKLWVKQVAFTDGRLGETYSYYQHGFNLPSETDTGDIYVEQIIGWDSPTLLKVILKWTCTPENLDGIYLLDLSTLTAEKIGESEG